MSRPVCCNCGVEMICSKTGVAVLTVTESIGPYCVQYGDKFTCHCCTNSVVVNRGAPIEHHQRDFQTYADCASIVVYVK